LSVIYSHHGGGKAVTIICQGIIDSIDRSGIKPIIEVVKDAIHHFTDL
jgi:hypothetical protein